MISRVLHTSLLVVAALLLFRVNAQAQSSSRRGQPSNLSKGYFVVDNYDNAPLPWRPQYSFIDTLIEPITWSRVYNGPQQFARPGYFFFDPTHLTNLPAMDTTNNCLAGPIPIGFDFNFYNTIYDSVYISSNGYLGFGLYSNATTGSYPYSDQNAVDLVNGNGSAPKDIVAAIWADLDMHPVGDTSKVYVRTSPTLDTFMVNFYNFRLRPGSPNNFSPVSTNSQGADRIFIKQFQIVLTRVDSSIQINYGSFSGAVNSFPPVQAWRLFQNNSAVGLNDQTGAQGTGVLYKNTWEAVNTTCANCNKNWAQNGQFAYKFRRWHDIVKAVSVDYPPRNYEICLGASVTPVATFQNVDSIQHSFKVRFVIRNVVTGIAVYGRTVPALNVNPGAKQQVTSFEPYATNPNILNELGTFQACAIATSYDTSNVYLGDLWPFDDTVCIQIFGVRTNSQPFNDASDNYSITTTADIPDQTQWISIGTNVVDGNSATWDPPPPYGTFGAHQYTNPTIHMDRQDIGGNLYSGSNTGDTLLSFPINLLGFTKAGFSFDYQRGGQQTYPWLWDEDIMYGPEHTVLNINGSVLRHGDSLAIEFKQPSQPACNPAGNGWTEVTAIDGGHDFEFHKFFAHLEKYLPGTNYFTNNFRFRVRLKANDNGNDYNPPPSDDADDWYVDNFSVQVPRKPEIEVMWVRCVNPFSKIPASQAVSLPVYVHLANNSQSVAIAFPINVQITSNTTGELLYNQTTTITSLTGGTDSTVQMPNWNARNASNQGAYTLVATLSQLGYDSYLLDNTATSTFYLNVEQGNDLTQEFAWDNAGVDPGPGAGNDWPGIVQVTGQGIGWSGNNGSFATKFRLLTKDTVYGVRVYFADANQAPDEIRISLLSGSLGTCTPNDTIASMQSVRLGNYFNQFWAYYFPHPIVLPGGEDAPGTQGVYWISISQLGLENMMMGANLSRGGGLIRVADAFTPQIPPIYNDPYGTQSQSDLNNGDASCAWALEETAGSGSWGAWTPNNGWWPTMSPAGLPLAWNTNVNYSYYIWGGSYTPMIRPLVSHSPLVPVEFLYLNGKPENNSSALLTWATAKEVNNQDFEIQRQPASVQDAAFSHIGDVLSSVTNSNQTTAYSYVDNNVAPGTYNYRLVQRDLNGAEHVSNTVEVTIASPTDFELGQNYPNPFTPAVSGTDISFTVSATAPTQVVLYNMLGQAVRTLYTGTPQAGSQRIHFDGRSDDGSELPSGTYMYKMISGQFSDMKKLTITR